ncbi:MAG TPA: orotidine-5'-phosphate decarboxylase, partial [Opitutae bacterium]|nr:orotidine-5'-phosphate decarboxylase [Opitutae bacterium]
IGLQMFTKYGPEYVREISDLGKKVFLDLKLHDIPNTVAKAIASISELPIDMLTIHTCGGREMIEWAVRSQHDHKPELQLLGVTVLTSMDDEALAGIGVNRSAAEQVSALTALASDAGLSGLVCSPHEAAKVKSIHGNQFKLITPGIRPVGADAGDQKRIMTPRLAAEQGADFIVVGRPIYQAEDPESVVKSVLEDLR